MNLNKDTAAGSSTPGSSSHNTSFTPVSSIRQQYIDEKDHNKDTNQTRIVDAVIHHALSSHINQTTCIMDPLSIQSSNDASVSDANTSKEYSSSGWISSATNSNGVRTTKKRERGHKNWRVQAKKQLERMIEEKPETMDEELLQKVAPEVFKGTMSRLTI